VQVEGTLQPREKQNLELGVKLEDGITAPGNYQRSAISAV